MRTVGVLAAGAVLAAALAVPVVMAHASARTQVGQRQRADVLHYSARASDYLRPNAGNRTYPSLAQWDGEGERRLFPGFVMIGLAVIGLWPLSSRVRAAYLLAAVIAFDASRGLHGVIYTLLWDYVPTIGGFRVPARFGVLTALALAVLAGWGVSRLCQGIRTPHLRYLLVGVLSAAILVESRTFPLDLDSIGRRTPDVYRWLAAQPRTAVLELPVEDGNDFGYMYYSTLHWQPIVNGQSGFFPTWYSDLGRMAQVFPTDEAVAFLRGRGVTHVFVHRRLLGEARYHAMTNRLAERPDVRLVRSFPPSRSETDVYRLTR